MKTIVIIGIVIVAIAVALLVNQWNRSSAVSYSFDKECAKTLDGLYNAINVYHETHSAFPSSLKDVTQGNAVCVKTGAPYKYLIFKNAGSGAVFPVLADAVDHKGWYYVFLNGDLFRVPARDFKSFWESLGKGDNRIKAEWKISGR